MIEEDLSRVEESATKSTYRLGIRFERCEKKNENIAPKFVPSFSCHKEEEALKPTKAHYPFNPKSSFNPKRDVKRESYKPREKSFICMFYDRADYLDEFCFQRKRIEKRHFDYARNSYRDKFIDLPPHSYSRVPPRSYSRASPRTSARAFSQFSYGPNHHSYDFGSRENRFEPRRFDYAPCPRRGYRFLRMPDFPAEWSFTHFEPRHLNGPHFPRRG
jgi:hypothetical protein